MKRVDFNHGWTCRPLQGDGEAIPVTLPHDAMRTEERTAASRGGDHIGWFRGGDYEYSRTFTALPEWREGRLLLEFESVYHNAEVWINGRQAAFRPYGYTNFYVDPVPYMNWDGPNKIRVIARNADQPNSRWYTGTGMLRPVWLWTGPRACIPVNGIHIDTVSVRPARIRVRVRTSQPGPVAVRILEEKRQMASVTAESLPVAAAGTHPDRAGYEACVEMEMPRALLWSPGHPNLYRAEVRFGEDTVSETFGIRTLTWSPAFGLCLNSRRVLLRGACIHQDHGILGGCSFPEAEERRIRILLEAGYNAIRCAHNPASKYLLEACDRLGMLVMDEYCDCWYIHKTAYDYASHMEQWWRQDLTDMVEKDYNHPSVILYSTGNEVVETAREKGVQLQQAMTDHLHSLDPSRPVTCGINIFLNALDSAGISVFDPEKVPDPEKKASGSEFYNRMAARLGTGFMKLGASLPASDRHTKDAFAAMDIAGYNYGIRRYKADSRKYPDRIILGTESLIGDTWDFMELQQKIPQIAGDFVWAGWDYLGECGLSDPEYASYRTGRPQDKIMGQNCRIDLTGKLTPEADYTRIAFGLEQGPRIAVWPVNETRRPVLTGWQMTRAVRSWSWRGHSGTEAEVEVFCRAPYVDLIINGTKLGKKKTEKGRAVFHTVYRDGDIAAVAFDRNGRETGRDILHTAGPETMLRLEPEQERCHEGSLVWLRIRCTDAAGETKPLERSSVRISVRNGTLIGCANASVYFEGSYACDTVPLYMGEAQAIVRADGSGPLQVFAEAGSKNAGAEIPCDG